MTIHTFPLHATPTLAVRRELDRLFDDVFVNRPLHGATASRPPLADAREDAAGFTIELDVPGVALESIEVLAEDGVLTVKGSRSPRELSDGERIVFAETGRGDFERRFRLAKSADLQAVRASYARGVLTVRVGKLAPAQPRKVTVTVEN